MNRKTPELQNGGLKWYDSAHDRHLTWFTFSTNGRTDATIIQTHSDKWLAVRIWTSPRNCDIVFLTYYVTGTCITLRVSNKTKLLKSNYTIHGHTLLSAIDQVPKSQQKRARQEEEASGKAIPNTAKYLGVYINGKLSWNHHVDAVTKKATSTLWFLHRNTASCPRSLFLNAGTMFALSQSLCRVPCFNDAWNNNVMMGAYKPIKVCFLVLKMTSNCV